MVLPAGIGCLFSCIIPHHILRVEGQGLFNMYIEFLIRRSRSKWMTLLRESKVAATLMFGVFHTCILYGFLKTSSRMFWVTSYRINEKELDEKSKCECIHGKLTCIDYWKQVEQASLLLSN